ncbi:Uncharacterised protein [Candidatus Anstonella stagnisolia]|nr:Uncharacterised protein [Candidatus Anstonella stagnisolia]
MENKHGILFPIVLLLNIAAVFVGIWFYSGQLASSSPLLWIFIPDCPLYIFLCTLILIGKIKSDLLRLLISANTLKYGLWTMLVLFFYGNYYFSSADIILYCIFMLGHFGMAAEGFLLFPKKVGTTALLFLLAWFLLNDFADYALGAHPSIPLQYANTIALFALALSFAIAILVPILSKAAHSRYPEMLKSFLF